MTAKEAYDQYQFPLSPAGSHTPFWHFVEESTHKGPLIQSLRQNIRDWWQALSEHEKLDITEIPLPLLDAASSDWTKTTNRCVP